MTKTTRRVAVATIARSAAVFLGLLVAACGGPDSGGSAASEASERTASELPVQEPTGPVDRQLAERGEELFRSRGCVACHTMGEGRRVGPDLEGVVERREFEWTYHMVVNPDSMLRNDSIARQLLSEYFTPMSDQNVTPEQFRAIYEYLRAEGR